VGLCRILNGIDPMPTSKNFIAYLEDCFGGIRGVRFRAMFGEYALYLDDVVVGLVCNQALFIKVTEKTSLLLKDRVGTGPPYSGAKDAFVLTESELEDDELIAQVMWAAHTDLIKPAMKKQKPARKCRALKDARK
jgi:TfoX/Sxy family transcriptional regulator of competence genes